MRTLSRALAAAFAAAGAVGLLSVVAPPAVAAPDLSGRWVSDSLRDNRIGYYLVLREAPGRAVGYVGHLRFERQSGQRDPRIPVSVTVVGDNVVITAREGRFDKSGRTISARLDRSGALVLTNCLDRLQQVMSWDLASDCTLRPKG
jgi:hypothetical protein